MLQPMEILQGIVVGVPNTSTSQAELGRERTLKDQLMNMINVQSAKCYSIFLLNTLFEPDCHRAISFE